MKWLIYVLLTIGLLMIMGHTVAQELSKDEARDLSYAREEEKLARDLYQEFFELYEHHIFERIAAAEQRHMDKIGSLLDVYNLADPIAEIEAQRGEFNSPAVRQLYEKFYAKGILSRTEALSVGAEVEERSIHDLQLKITHTANPQLLQTYENLMEASEHHLQAFVRSLEMEGASYQAVILSPDHYDAILNKKHISHHAKADKEQRGKKYMQGMKCKG
jgi:hypothetical protein